MRARHDAEANGKPLLFPEESAQRRPDLVAGQLRAFSARKSELESKLRGTRQQINQKEAEVRELESKLRATRNNLTLGRERLKMSKSLLAEGLTPKIEHLQLQAEVESLGGELNGLTPAISRARAAVEEAK